MRAGSFIVFEGIDGSGKTTHSARLRERLESAGHSTLLTMEPSERPAGKFLRHHLHNPGPQPFDELTRCMLFAADRRDHLVHEISPALDAGKIVICDRYVLSTAAYQVSSGGVSPRQFNDIHGHFPAPRLTLLLLVDPKDVIERIGSRKSLSVYERLDHLQRIHEAYLSLIDDVNYSHHNIVPIDASGSREETEICIQRAVDAELQRPPMLRISW